MPTSPWQPHRKVKQRGRKVGVSKLFCEGTPFVLSGGSPTRVADSPSKRCGHASEGSQRPWSTKRAPTQRLGNSRYPSVKSAVQLGTVLSTSLPRATRALNAARSGHSRVHLRGFGRARLSRRPHARAPDVSLKQQSTFVAEGVFFAHFRLPSCRYPLLPSHVLLPSCRFPYLFPAFLWQCTAWCFLHRKRLVRNVHSCPHLPDPSARHWRYEITILIAMGKPKLWPQTSDSFVVVWRIPTCARILIAV